MQQEDVQLFEALLEVNRRPEPYGEYTARELWTDPHTSEQMLACHLDKTLDAASRNHKFIDRSIEWIRSDLGLSSKAKVADFGCGPGLYTQRLARAGFDVTGIDFSDRSLRYAREMASTEGLDIEYIHADYLEIATNQTFDLITMIMCDFCALSPVQRGAILCKFGSILAPGGVILLDVYSTRMFDAREETATYGPDLMAGFWSSQPYYGFLNTFKFEEERLVLDKYTIVERDRVRRIFNWFQCFTLQDIEREFAAWGLQVVEWYGDVAGGPYDPETKEIAVIAQKATH